MKIGTPGCYNCNGHETIQGKKQLAAQVQEVKGDRVDLVVFAPDGTPMPRTDVMIGKAGKATTYATFEAAEADAPAPKAAKPAAEKTTAAKTATAK